MNTVYSICMVMFGNGAAICMALIQLRHKLTQKEQYQGSPMYVVGVVGMTMPGVADQHIATTSLQHIPTIQ